jgi:hypothetical protein
MKYKIINIYAGFPEITGATPWRVFFGNDYIDSFSTRATARAYIKALKSGVTL